MQQTVATANGAIEEWSETDHRMMARALTLAAKGTGQVSPGPLVGCVITNAEGEVIGEGFYVYEAVKHAETLALEQAGDRAKGATAYVSLEPHAHFGRTSPCTDALIAAGIRRVVAPIEDPNPKVSGRGFEHLRAAGLEVTNGLMAGEARKVNEKYFQFMKTGRPFVHLKLATSLDGKIATRTGDSRWITGPESRARAHELRHEYDAILIGAGTALADDPLLTDRSSKPRRRPLVRILLDERLQTDPESQLVRTAKEAPVLIFSGESRDAGKIEVLQSRGVEIVSDSSKGRDLPAVLEELGKRSLQSVLIEGGATVAGNLIDAGLVDKVTFFLAPVIIGGRDAPNAIGGHGTDKLIDALNLVDVEMVQRGRDIEVTGYPKAKDEG
ncbi:MAG: bifunctional diaminohydroxyphosphoribosylaminopyrimidine deaminase/5-amino-6-(5-phosphoribosylamino)uracil reductase RibD [Pyrinomonadaceae bacterium]|nr:bifunctional diaminohydroxyphosphoribosylaminopyrimidine deaminase/5-amino-6-(5-phosphoribosylamino)uracil reductase RibD [Pyrinomonadaceae bacterium]